MELQNLPSELLLWICRFLNAGDICALGCVSQTLNRETNDPYLWRSIATQRGFILNHLSAISIRRALNARCQAMETAITSIVPSRHPHLHRRVLAILFQDDADGLVEVLVNHRSRSANAIMAVATKFSRIRIMSALLECYTISHSFEWVLMAIRYGQLHALEFLLEVRKVKLLDDHPAAKLPASGEYWDENYSSVSNVGRFFAGKFESYSHLVMSELLRCPDAGLVRYVKNRIVEELLDFDANHPYQELFGRIRRHSVGSGYRRDVPRLW